MDSATPAPNGDARGTGAPLDDAEIYRRHSEGQKYPQIMAELGISRGGLHKALKREEARRQLDTADPPVSTEEPSAELRITGGGVRVTDVTPTRITGGGVRVTKVPIKIITKPPRVTKSKPQTAVLSVVPKDATADVIDLKPDSVDIEEADLDELAAIANKWHDAAVGTYLESAWHAGSALIAAKAQLDHGQWLPWLESYFHGSRQTAADYMRIAGAGDSPANVVRALHLDETPQPSIRAATKALTGGTAQPKSKAGSKDSTVVNRFLKRMDAVADAARTDVSKRLGTMTQTEATEVATLMRGAIDVLEQLYDLVADIADHTNLEQS
jgi:hypothetical protein